jgi:hypothetical protein
MKSVNKRIFIVICVLCSNELVFGQEMGLSAYQFFSNSNDKIENYYPINSLHNIAFANQKETEAPILRLYNKANLYIDSLDLAIYFQQIIPINQSLLVVGLNGSYLIPYDSTGFDLESMIAASRDAGSECLLFNVKQYCWQEVKEKKGLMGKGLVSGDEVLIDQIPTKFKKGNLPIEAPQRHLDLRQYYHNSAFVFAYFKAQRIYILSPEDNSIAYYDFPEINDGVWYYFPDIETGRHYLVKETAKSQFELYGYYLESGVKKLFDLNSFPIQLFNESVLYKEEYKGEIAHILKPFKAYKK